MVFGALAYLLAVVLQVSLVQLLLLSYGFIAQLFPLLLATFFWPRATPAGALAGLLAGGLVTLALNLIPGASIAEVHPGIWGILANLIVLVVVSFATPPMDDEHVAHFVVD